MKRTFFDCESCVIGFDIESKSIWMKFGVPHIRVFDTYVKNLMAEINIFRMMYGDIMEIQVIQKDGVFYTMYNIENRTQEEFDLLCIFVTDYLGCWVAVRCDDFSAFSNRECFKSGGTSTDKNTIYQVFKNETYNSLFGEAESIIYYTDEPDEERLCIKLGKYTSGIECNCKLCEWNEICKIPKKNDNTNEIQVHWKNCTIGFDYKNHSLVLKFKSNGADDSYVSLMIKELSKFGISKSYIFTGTNVSSDGENIIVYFDVNCREQIEFDVLYEFINNYLGCSIVVNCKDFSKISSSAAFKDEYMTGYGEAVSQAFQRVTYRRFW